MANDTYDINVKGLGGSSQSSKIDTSGIQRSIDQVANDLKKLDTSNFQKSLKDLTQGIQVSAKAAQNFVSNMQKIEAQIASSIKAGLSPGMGNSSGAVSVTPKETTRKNAEGFDAKNSEKFSKSLDGLSSAIDKLTSGLKENLKAKNTEEKPEAKKENIVNDVKKLLSAVGIGAIAKQIAENEIVNPAKATGMLIASNVVSNPRQIGSDLLASYQNRVAGNTSSIFGMAGGAIGLAIGAVTPLDPIAGAYLGYKGGKAIGDVVGQTKTAPELAIQQRALSLDYYSNLSKQLPQYGQFAQSQYGPQGFMSNAAARDPYFESKAILGSSYSRFAGGSLDEKTTSGILGSLTAQGNSTPQELNITGNLLGQIARFTGKTSVDIEKVYKSVERSGLSPNEGLQKALTLLQSGQSVKDTIANINNSSQRTAAFSAGQDSYMSASPFQQYSAQLAAGVAGIDEEKFFNGTASEKAAEAKKVRKIYQGAALARKRGISGLDQDSIFAEMLQQHAHITAGMADKVLNIPHAKNGDYFSPGKITKGILDETGKALDKGAAGRDTSQIIKDTLESIGNSTQAFKGLTGATGNLAKSFEDLALSLFIHTRDPNSSSSRFSLPSASSPSLAEKYINMGHHR
jgi:hypothetical protein